MNMLRPQKTGLDLFRPLFFRLDLFSDPSQSFTDFNPSQPFFSIFLLSYTVFNSLIFILKLLVSNSSYNRHRHKRF